MFIRSITRFHGVCQLLATGFTRSRIFHICILNIPGGIKLVTGANGDPPAEWYPA